MLVGRERELGSITSELASPDRVVTVFVHGPGGIGKTALLREATARAEDAYEFSVLWLDGRDIAPVPDQLEDALGAWRLERERLLIALDSFEHVEALGGYLRRALIPSLPTGAALLIASRRAPGPEWEPRGVGAGFVELGVEPLDPEGSAEVLRRNGAFGEGAERARSWARGNPLALELVAASARRDPDGRTPSGSDFGERLIARLVEERLEGPHLATLATAAIARVTTPDLLAACLVGADPATEWEWLCGRSFMERRGVGVAPHELVREGIRAGIRR
ncbi:MAG TPA: ATP-binding protein, partial [Solirubrobacterales bacterium]